MSKKNFLSITALSGSLLLVAIIFSATIGHNFSLSASAGKRNAENALVLSCDNPVVDSQAKTNKGNTIWVKGDASSGVTWNYANNKVELANGGYIQTLTMIHGITEVSISMDSGSVSLYHGWVEPSDLCSPMYESGYTFTSSGAFSYTSNYPNRIRIRANAYSVLNSITIRYDCVSAYEDLHIETMDDGLENSYIDAGSLLKYASTSFVTGENNVFGDSKRSLKIDFNGTTNNYVSLNFEQDVSAGLIDANPDMSASTLTLKAKFSDNITEYGISVCPLGSGWEHPGYLIMDRSFNDENGWYSYSLDLSDISFNGNNSIVRLNVAPIGINANNKSTAYVLLDEIDYHLTTKNRFVRYETINDGLENMSHDKGWENCYYKYNKEVVYGRKSTSSLEIKPGKSSVHGTMKWFTMFGPAEENYGTNRFDLDLSSGLLTMQYKPINVNNPTSVVFAVYKDWDGNNKTTTVNTRYLSNGWYHFEYNLSNLNLPSGAYIRFGFGFDVSNENINQSVIYIDNIKVREIIQEDYTLGWENMARDTGWETCNTSVDNIYKSSDTSYNSIRVSFEGKTANAHNLFSFILSPDEQHISSGLNFTNGILTAKFLFSGDIVDKTIRLVLVDSDWVGLRYDLTPIEIGDGWYLLKVNFSSMPSPVWNEPNYDGLGIIRFGFGFHGINNSNKSSATVWIDDVFYENNSNISSLTSATLWEAYNTENILQTDSVISGREISNNRPLEFSGLKNETVNTQLMIKANSTISSYSLKMGTLYSNDGSHINPEDFSVYVEKYLSVTKKSAEKKSSSYGWRGEGIYPDGLVPMDRIIKANENTITSGNQQGLWIDLKISRYAKAGTYTGNAVLTLNGGKFDVPISVTIYGALMEDTLHNRSCYLVWNDMFQTEYGEGPGSNTAYTQRIYYDYLLDYRVNAGGIHNYDRYDTYEQFADDFASEVAFNEKITTYRLPTDGSYENLYGYFSALINKNKELWDEGYEINFFDKIILYIDDEPAEPTDSNIPDAWENSVKVHQTNLNNAINTLKNSLDNYPVLKNSFVNTRNVLPMNCDYETLTGGSYKYGTFNLQTGYYPNLFNGTYIDTPCPTFDHLNVSSERASYFSTFDKVWFYGCCVPVLPYPSYHLDTSLVGQRMIRWMQYYYGVEGEIYYCINNFRRSDYDGHNDEDRDPWTDPFSYGYGAGDGMLVYPGKKYDVIGPLPSMRLENIRNSQQDYEYFYMIDQRIAQYNAIHNTNYTSCYDIITSYCSNMFSGTQINHNFSTASFISYHTALLTIIDELY